MACSAPAAWPKVGNSVVKKAGASGPLESTLRESRGVVAWAMAFGAAVALLYLAPSLFMMQVYDRVLASGGVTTLWLLGVALAFALATLVFLDEIRARLAARFSFRLERQVAPLILDATIRRPRAAGDARARQAMRDFDVLRQTIQGPAANALMDAPWAPIYIVVCALIHPLIGGVVLLGAVLLGLLALRNEVVLRRSLDAAAEAAPRLYAEQEGDVANAETLRALGMREAMVTRHLARRADINALQADTAFSSLRYTAIIKFLRMALQSTALGLGAFLAIKGQISPGALIAATILSSRALAPVEQIVGSWRQLRMAANAYNAVSAALAAAGPKVARLTLPSPRGEVRFENVGLRGNDDDRWIVRDLTFTLAPGEVLVVVGPSGAGKSTLARLAAGAIHPDLGVVRMDGADYHDWEPDALGRHVGYLPQDVGLIEGTIAENISRFEAAVASRADLDARIIAASRAAGAHDIVLRTSQGYNAMLGPGGRGLSVGQAQRIGLARAFFGAPALLVLDEPNAHLDAEGEASLIAAVKSARERGAAVLIVAHRAGVIALADRLLVMRGGRIEALGPRDEIARRFSASQQGENVAPLRPREAP